METILLNSYVLVPYDAFYPLRPYHGWHLADYQQRRYYHESPFCFHTEYLLDFGCKVTAGLLRSCFFLIERS